MTAVTSSSTHPDRGEVTERDAREVAEAARETEWRKPSFAKQLFEGRLQTDLVHPHPRPTEEQRRKGEEFLKKLRAFCEASVDGPLIEQEAWIPDKVVHGFKELGAFGMKISPEYGGLGLSHLSYNRALMIVSSVSPAVGALLSAHQSIGVPQPLALFGTEEQKQRFLPRCARGEISAFLLTEPDVGSDPARLGTTAVPSEDGSEYTLNGVKLWTTNGVVADLLVVMAQVPKSDGHRGGITAFVVEADAEGITVEHRNSFHGLRGLENGVTRFHDVRVPAANLSAKRARPENRLVTLNTGRLSLPAILRRDREAGVKIAREWSQPADSVGQPDWRARGDGEEDLVHRGHHLRSRHDRRPVRPDRRREPQRHPHRGGAGQAVLLARWPGCSPTSLFRSAAGAATRPQPRWPPAANVGTRRATPP